MLSVLEKRALRYRRKGQKEVDQDEVLYNEALNETGTVSTAALSDSDDESLGSETFREPITAAEAAFLERGAISGKSDDLLNVHGVAPGPKPEGVTRLIYENPDGFNTRIRGNEKLEKAKEIIDEL